MARGQVPTSHREWISNICSSLTFFPTDFLKISLFCLNLFFKNWHIIAFRWLTSRRIQLPSRRCGLDPWVRKIPWRRKWQPTPVFLPEASHGRRSLVGYSPGDLKRARHDLETEQQQDLLHDIVSFCRTTTWMSDMHTYIPSQLSLPPTTPKWLFKKWPILIMKCSEHILCTMVNKPLKCMSLSDKHISKPGAGFLKTCSLPQLWTCL